VSIEISNLNFFYGSRQVLHDVCLNIAQAQTLAILGPNGSGKTTLLSIVAGLIKAQDGSITYNGKTFKFYNPREMARLVGYVPQFIVPAFDYSVIDYVVTGCAPQMGTFQRPKKEHYEKAMQSICEMGIEHLADKSYKQLSGGERQQVTIARVLTQSPVFILMDEPTSHLDYGNQVHVLKTIKRLAKNGFGVVFTTHNPDQALLIGGETAIINRKGNLIFGEGQKMLNDTFLSELYETRLRIADFDVRGRKVCFAPALGEDDYHGHTSSSD